MDTYTFPFLFDGRWQDSKIDPWDIISCLIVLFLFVLKITVIKEYIYPLWVRYSLRVSESCSRIYSRSCFPLSQNLYTFLFPFPGIRKSPLFNAVPFIFLLITIYFLLFQTMYLRRPTYSEVLLFPDSNRND